MQNYAIGETMSNEDSFAHYGVAGMKWGKSRAKGGRSEILAARGRVETNRKKAENELYKAANVKGKEARNAALAEARKVKKENLKNPDRVLSSRLSRGEKVASVIILSPIGGALLIGATSANSRRIERKQETGAYDN